MSLTLSVYFLVFVQTRLRKFAQEKKNLHPVHFSLTASSKETAFYTHGFKLFIYLFLTKICVKYSPSTGLITLVCFYSFIFCLFIVHFWPHEISRCESLGGFTFKESLQLLVQQKTKEREKNSPRSKRAINIPCSQMCKFSSSSRHCSPKQYTVACVGPRPPHPCLIFSFQVNVGLQTGIELDLMETKTTKVKGN